MQENPVRCLQAVCRCSNEFPAIGGICRRCDHGHSCSGVALPAVRERRRRRLPPGEPPGLCFCCTPTQNIIEVATRPPPRCLQGYGSGGSGGLPPPHNLRSTSQPSSSSSSSLVLYTNATVWTGDAAGAHAEAFLVDGATGRFVFVGDRRGALTAAAAQPAEVDLQGAHVIPGKRMLGCIQKGYSPARWHSLCWEQAVCYCPAVVTSPCRSSRLLPLHASLLPVQASLMLTFTSYTAGCRSPASTSRPPPAGSSL